MSFQSIQFFGFNKISASQFSISGGVTSSYVDGSTTYMVHTFTSTDTMQVSGSGNIDYLVIAGGGGGSNGGNYGGGGGAGEQLYTQGFSINEGTYTITVGAGGAAQSIGNTSSIDSLVSAEFGYRGYLLGINTTDPIYGTFSGFSPQSQRGDFYGGTGDNNAPWFRGGGGAGANQNGFNHNDSTAANRSRGGYGFTCSITGTDVIRGGGGGGAASGNFEFPPGGAGGGGEGAGAANTVGGAGVVNTGSGGGGAINYIGGAGGSGVVIISYAL